MDNVKPITKHELRTYRSVLEEINELTIEIQALYDEATRTTTRLSHTPGRGSRAKKDLSDHIALIIDLENQLTEKRAILVAQRVAIEEAIETLLPDERRVLRLKYIEGLSWRQIGFRLHYEERWLFALHSRALNKLLSRAYSTNGNL